jgi:hypothetical protein
MGDLLRKDGDSLAPHISAECVRTSHTLWEVRTQSDEMCGARDSLTKNDII